jgi:glycosyltransferase involved in cell wall biosynthesis
MKLIFAIKSLSQRGGGAERVFVDVVNGLHERGHDLAVLTFAPLEEESFYPLAPVKRLDFGATARGRAGHLLALPKARRVIMQHAPEAVVGFMPSCYVPLGAALAGSDIPMIGSEHNVPERYRRQPIGWCSILASTFYIQRFTAVSEQMRMAYPDRIRRRMSVLPNPVSVRDGARANVVGDGTGGRIIAVGRLHAQKDHLTLVRAFASVADAFPGWSLRILGDGEERQRLQAEVDTLGLGKRVELPGTVRDIGAEYAAAQLYVVPSRYESLGLATAEALAHGLPAIGFADCPGTNELIRDGQNGFLVAPGSDRITALEDALRAAILSPQLRLRMSEQALNSSGAANSETALNAWVSMLESVWSARPTP